MILFTSQKHSHSNTNNVDDETKRRRLDALKKYGSVCTCCHRKNIMQCDCVINICGKELYFRQPKCC